MKQEIIERYALLKNPAPSFQLLKKATLEDAVFSTVKILFALALVAGVVSFLLKCINLLYVQLFLIADINLARFLNFALSQAGTIFLFYLFGGTIGVFFLSLLLSAFLRKFKYAELLKITLYSASPILLFGWIPLAVLGLSVWCVILFIIGYSSTPSLKDVKRTIHERD